MRAERRAIREDLPADSMVPPRVTRLSWAGVKFETDDAALFLDPWEGTQFFGRPLTADPVPAVTDRRQRFVALTHLHSDHCDRAVLRRLIGSREAPGALHLLDRMVLEIGTPDLTVVPHALWEPRRAGTFTLVPLPAVDGWGDVQVAWVIVAGRFRAFHGGDGLWHGRWWDFGRAFGPFDLAFLPINGASTPGGDQPVHVARTLSPVEAAEAAVCLGARQVVPIHFGLSLPGVYEETPDLRRSFGEACQARGLSVQWAGEGSEVSL